MTFRLLISFSFGICFFFISCKGALPVVGNSRSGPVIGVSGRFVADPSLNPSTYSASASIGLNNLPEITDTVVLTTPTGSVTLPYNSNQNGMEIGRAHV